MGRAEVPLLQPPQLLTTTTTINLPKKALTEQEVEGGGIFYTGKIISNPGSCTLIRGHSLLCRLFILLPQLYSEP